jgi:hypothetical protein
MNPVDPFGDRKRPASDFVLLQSLLGFRDIAVHIHLFCNKPIRNHWKGQLNHTTHVSISPMHCSFLSYLGGPFCLLFLTGPAFQVVIFIAKGDNNHLPLQDN